MSGWSRHIDLLASAAAELLVSGRLPNQPPLQDAAATLSARDAVVAELRQLVGAVADTPRHTDPRALTVDDVLHRPGQALHQALTALPRAVPFGTTRPSSSGARKLGQYEALWQQAAHATIGLEAYVDALAELPGTTGWAVLRDLADVSACLPFLDHDLSLALEPTNSGDRELAAAQQALTHPGHQALHIIATELRQRVPSSQPAPDQPAQHRGPATAAARPLLPAARDQQRRLNGASTGFPALPTAASEPLRTARRPLPTTRQPSPNARQPLPTGRQHLPTAEQVDRTMAWYSHTLSQRSTRLSIADFKATRRLLEYGSALAADALTSVLPEPTAAVDALARTAHAAERLRGTPAKSASAPHLPLLAASRDLLEQLTHIAVQARSSAQDAAPGQLHELFAPVLAFASRMPQIADALDLSVREALADQTLLVPGSTTQRGATFAGWITATMQGATTETPAIAAGTSQLADAARRVPPALKQALTQALSEPAACDTNASSSPARTAREHAGHARADLREALRRRATDDSAWRPEPLPEHPRLAIPPTAAGRRH